MWSQMTPFPCPGWDHCNVYFLFQVDFPLKTHYQIKQWFLPILGCYCRRHLYFLWYNCPPRTFHELSNYFVKCMSSFHLAMDWKSCFLIESLFLKMDILSNTGSHRYLWKIAKEILQNNSRVTLQKSCRLFLWILIHRHIIGILGSLQIIWG